MVAFGVLAVRAPASGEVGWSNADRVMTGCFGLALAALLWRFASLRAIPSKSGLKVFNLIRTHDLEWARIIGVGYSGGSPWAVLECSDTEEIAVMAIQRSDGDRARQEASRLAALVLHHSAPERR
ncbi:MAG: PH domain-containing protein [Ornithinimicrobium sp.]